MEQHSILTRKEIIAHVATWINLEGSILSEISQSQKEKCNDDFTYMRFPE